MKQSVFTYMAGYQTEFKLYKVILKQNKNIITFGLYCWVAKQFIMLYIIIMTTQRILHYKVEIRPATGLPEPLSTWVWGGHGPF